MRILMLHNRYQKVGGEDGCFEMEVDLLRRFGCEVVTLEENNERINDLGVIRTALRTTWSQESYQAVRKRLRDQRFDVLHVQNFFPLFSPSVYYAAQAEGVPVVQTLHNYRLMCPVGTFNRAGRVCEDCMHRAFPWPSVIHRCYRDSAMASAVVGTMIAVNAAMGTWYHKVDAYIVLTEFMRQKFLKRGFPAEKLHVKPNFLAPDPGLGARGGGFAFFAGRLNPEKGVGTLLRAWEQLDGKLKLKIAGVGPMEPEVKEAARRLSSVEYIGWQPNTEIIRLMGEASIFLLPTENYEGHPRSAVEAFARGIPVVGTRIGAMAEMIEDGKSGILFNPGDAEDLVSKISWVLCHPDDLIRIGLQARREFVSKYTAERNYEMLMNIYQSVAISRRSAVEGRISA
jgi:glycosyltransferase involved in cell wall biosynthesis